MEEFVIVCKMKKRWISPFLSMLKLMQHMGDIGASREVSLYADGDGDFQPKFDFDIDVDLVKAIEEERRFTFDAG